MFCIYNNSFKRVPFITKKKIKRLKFLPIIFVCKFKLFKVKVTFIVIFHIVKNYSVQCFFYDKRNTIFFRAKNAYIYFYIISLISYISTQILHMNFNESQQKWKNLNTR